MPEITFKVSNCIAPVSLLNTMPRNPSCIQPGVSSVPTTYSLHLCPVSAPPWVLHPNVWWRSSTFFAIWAEGKYPEASSLPHQVDWKKWCRCFSHSARRRKTERIFQLCSPFFSLTQFLQNLLKGCVFGIKGLEALMTSHFCLLATSFSYFNLTSIRQRTFQQTER